MKSNNSQVIKRGVRVRRKEWGLLDLDERDAKSCERERVFSRSTQTDGPHRYERTRPIREL